MLLASSPPTTKAISGYHPNSACASSLLYIIASITIRPDEILLDIASRLDIPSLSNLARSHYRFGAVARKCLVREAGVSPNQVPNLVTMLVRNPALVTRLTHLHLGPLNQNLLLRMWFLQVESGQRLSFELFCRRCGDAWKTTKIEWEQIIWATASRDGCESLYSMGLSLLIAQVSGLSALTINA